MTPLLLEGLRVNAIGPGFFLGEQNRAMLVNGEGAHWKDPIRFLKGLCQIDPDPRAELDLRGGPKIGGPDATGRCKSCPQALKSEASSALGRRLSCGELKTVQNRVSTRRMKQNHAINFEMLRVWPSWTLPLRKRQNWGRLFISFALLTKKVKPVQQQKKPADRQRVSNLSCPDRVMNPLPGPTHAHLKGPLHVWTSKGG